MTNVEKCNNTSVGMIVKKNDQILLIEKKKYPFGFAPPAGHVDEGESYENAAKRELLEEVGMVSTEIKILIEGKKNNKCRRPGGSWHYWKIYEVQYDSDKVKIKKDEVKNANWYSLDEIEILIQKTKRYIANEISEKEWESSPGLEPVWYEWFKEIKIIKEQ